MSTLATANEKDIEWPSMTAPMDIRSAPDKVDWGNWRLLQNVRARETGKLCRREGWRRFGWETEHPNCDLHDQHREVDEVIRTGYLHPGNTGIAGSRLFMALQTDIWMLRQDGGWELAAENLPEGDADIEFSSLNDLIFACNSKTVLYQQVGFDDFAAIPSAALIGLTGAGGTFQYQGCVFFFDVVMDNARLSHRVVWSDVNSYNLEPSSDSIAGFNDFTPGEKILAAVPLGNVYYLFTSHGCWRLGVAEGQFQFQQQYFSKESDACLVSKEAIATTREVAYFMAKDGIYTMTPYSPAPQWTQSINLSLPREFIGPTNQCVIEAAGYDTDRHEVLFSAPSLGKTFVICLRFGNTSIIDHAFTMLVSANMDRSRDMAQRWAGDGICTPEQILEFWPPGPRDDERIWPVQGTAAACDAFKFTCEPCLGVLQMIGASTVDGSLKVFDSDFYAREMRTEDDWESEGYRTRFVTGAMKWGIQVPKRLTQILVEFTAEPTDEPLDLVLMLGQSATPVDPAALGSCPARTLTMSGRRLTCGTMPSGLSPNALPARWNPLFEGRFIWFDFSIGPDTGGAASFSRMVAWVSRAPGGTP